MECSIQRGDSRVEWNIPSFTECSKLNNWKYCNIANNFPGRMLENGSLKIVECQHDNKDRKVQIKKPKDL
jgi:hypothetical protein